MSDETNWKQKCKRVAEWLDDMCYTFCESDECINVVKSSYAVRSSYYEEDGCVWPDYINSNVAAIRLQEAVPDHIKDTDGRLWIRSMYKSTHRGSYCVSYDNTGTGQLVELVGDGDAYSMEISTPGGGSMQVFLHASSEESMRHAMVKTAYELANCGVEPETGG